MARPAGSTRRHVLHGMHGEVDVAGQQRLLDLLGEQALAADLGERPVLDAVAGGLDDAHLERASAGPCAASRRSRTSRACASASGEPRVPMRIVRCLQGSISRC